jgi:hypothetical protein
VEGESSKETSVDSGVPQGTVLGPIMLLCHIHDHVSGTFLKFLLRTPSVALAFLHTLLMRMLHFRSFEIWSPKYGLSCTSCSVCFSDKLERIQNRAIRFVKKDYKSRETRAITRMRENLELETLEDRRLSLRLMYKVVEGLGITVSTKKECWHCCFL